MIVYWILLLVTAVIAYGLGSMSTLVLSSNFIFRYNLNRFGRGNDWLSNFKRVYGIKGALELLFVEAVKDILPIVLGGILLGIKGHADAGRAFAGFCLVMGRLWPVFYNLRGSHAVMPMVFAGIFVSTSLGIAVLVVFLLMLLVTKYTAIAAAVAAIALAVAPLLMIEDKVVIYLMAFTGAAVLIRHIPELGRVFAGRAEKVSFREDLSYKFETKF